MSLAQLQLQLVFSVMIYDIVKTPTQRNLITLSWVRHEDDFAYPMLPFGPFFLDFGLDPDFFEEIGLEMVRN